MQYRKDTENAFKGKDKAEHEQVRHLEKELARVTRERDILKKAVAIFSKGTESIYRFIEGHRTEFPVQEMCRVLSVSRSGYYKWQGHIPSKCKERRAQLDAEIKRIFNEHKERIGSPKMKRELEANGIYSGKESYSRFHA